MSGWAAAAGAAMDLGSAWLNYRAQKDINEDQMNMSRDQMAFQERMSNTAWQRSMADLKAAGLNPILGLGKSGFGPASSPAGSQPGTLQNPMEKAINSAVASATVRNIQAQNKKIEAEAENVQADTQLKLGQTTRLSFEISVLNEQAQKLLEESTTLQVARDKLRFEIKSAEWNVLRDEFRAKLQRSDFEDMRPEELRMLRAQATLLGLEIPKALNESLAQDSWWMREVSPYMRQFEGGARGGLDVRRMFRGR